MATEADKYNVDIRISGIGIRYQTPTPEVLFMLIDKMFTNSKLLEKALDASLLRNEVISHNIANVDTPGYKKKVVKFEEYLQNALDSSSNLIENINPTVETDMSMLSYRIDGNNVDIDTEMAEMAKNTIRYNLLISRMNSQFSKIKNVLRSN